MLSCTLLFHLPPAGGASAQQYLGNERQKCTGAVTVTASGGTLTVRPFESRSVDIGNTKVSWQCQDQQASDTQCPQNTNKVLIDRSQGGSTFSIICLHD
ncbi:MULTISPECIES: hypothetical protein [Rhodomicrobium]|uniref:hypothetical protein n=1 Tax=Rhodomicrobium TaxID=1068 RepID=UPI000B4B478C|nr:MULTISPECIES: hypothetical protein [Rhodomicrobium]